MKKLLIFTSLIISFNVFSQECNKILIAQPNPMNGGINYFLSDDGTTKSDDCLNLVSLKSSKNSKKICNQIAINNGYSCSVLTKDSISVSETSLSNSKIYEINNCWACK